MRPTTFLKFIMGDGRNRRLLLYIALGTMVQFIVFKFLYPYPDFYSDSYTYIYAASAHLGIDILPIGYSKFLSAFHPLSASDTGLVALQYFFLILAALYFYFTLLFFYQPGKLSRGILLVLLFVNPLILYIGNLVSSDSLFLALSLLWFGQLLWIINRPGIHHLLINAFLLFFCITLKDIAWYYPVISSLAFILSRQRISLKWIGIFAPVLLMLPFVVHTRSLAKEMTGTAKYSFSAGWQVANNAMMMREYIQPDSTQLPSDDVRVVDGMAAEFFRHIKKEKFDDYLSNYAGSFYIEETRAPLAQYFHRHFKSDDPAGFIASWGKASVILDEYGKWLIAHYPVSFARYFIMPNIRNYFLPPLERLQVYNEGGTGIELVAQDWFGYKTPTISAVSGSIQGSILFPFTYLFLMSQLLVLGTFIGWVMKKRPSAGLFSIDQLTGLTMAFLFLNFLFSMSTHPIVMKDMIAPMLISITATLLLLETLDKREGSVNKVVDIQMNNRLILNKL